jgi:hypothetical protein
MPYIGKSPDSLVTGQSTSEDIFTATANQTVFTLTADVTIETDIIVAINGVLQSGTAYSMGGTGNRTLTFSAGLTVGDELRVLHIGFKPTTTIFADETVTTAKLADNAVTSAKLGVDVIVAEDIAANAITVSELQDDAVTTDKIIDDAVTTDKILDNNITNAKIKSDAAIATSKLSGAVTSIGSHGLATSATTDTTNADNISSGTLPAGRYTDTVYTHPTTAGNKHIPTAGATDQVLTYSSSGTAAWTDPAGSDPSLDADTSPANWMLGSAAYQDAAELKLSRTERNFIIDGDFTQWPDGTAASTAGNGTYTSALVRSFKSHGGTQTVERSTDVPTAAESGHQSAYSLLHKCTVIDASMDAADVSSFRYFVTGSDFAHLHQQEITVSFWAKTAANNSGDTYSLSFSNGGGNRMYTTTFTPTSSWAQFTTTLTMDTSGTWLFTEADVGLSIRMVLVSGTNNQTATANTWQGITSGDALNTQSNFAASTSNELYVSQFGLYLGSTAPTFTSPPIATVKSQVDYYVQRYDLDNNAEQVFPVNVFAYNSSTCRAAMLWRREMRIKPSLTSTGSGTFEVRPGSGGIGSTTVNGNLSASYHGPFGGFVHFPVAAGTLTVGHTGHIRRYGSGTSWMMLDSRH